MLISLIMAGVEQACHTLCSRQVPGREVSVDDLVVNGHCELNRISSARHYLTYQRYGSRQDHTIEISLNDVEKGLKGFLSTMGGRG